MEFLLVYVDALCLRGPVHTLLVAEQVLALLRIVHVAKDRIWDLLLLQFVLE